jgi:hypothetical protein
MISHSRRTRATASHATPDRLSANEHTQLARAQLAALWVGLVIPLALTFAATVVVALWLPRLPDPVAVHWGVSFAADGYAAPWSLVALALGTGLLLSGLWLVGSLQRARPHSALWGPSFRLMPAIVLGTVTFLEIIAVGTARMQLDLERASDATGIGWLLGIGVIVWVAVTAGAYFVQPNVRISAPNAAVAEALPLAPTERAAWFGEVRPSTAFWCISVPTLAIFFGATLWSFVVGASEVAWILLASAVMVTALMLTNTWFRVRVDAAGLEARAPLGWPVYRVAAEDVAQVSAVQIRPFAEYGGWGVRLAPSGFGIVIRTGEGLLIERRSRPRSFAITLDGAAQAAALLAAAAQAAQPVHAASNRKDPHE